MDIQLHLMTGIDLPIPECQLILHQPSILEIGYLGETKFFSGLYTLVINKNSLPLDKTKSAEVTNFQVFMTVINSEEGAQKKADVKEFLGLVLPKYKVSFTPRTLIFMNGDEMISVDETNFDFLQNALKEAFCLSNQNMVQGNYNPGNEEARRIAEKLNRGRQIVAAQKGADKDSIFAQYVSILTVGLHSMSLQDVLKLTVFQLYDLIERYNLYTAWDIDMRVRLAGSKSDNKPTDWMKSLH